MLFLLLNMPTLNKAYCIVLYCIVPRFDFTKHIPTLHLDMNLLMSRDDLCH